MDNETKLDEDFVFYLGFVNSFLKHITEPDHKHKAEQWLQKLCGESFQDVDSKRGRNIYLSELLLCMQNGKLRNEFFVPLNEVNFANALHVFDLRCKEEMFPSWLRDKDVDPKPPEEKVERTYLATRTLPRGQGAFAYVAVSLDDQEPRWLGGGEGVFNKHMEEVYKATVPSHEMEKILARRKDPKEREKVVTFYTVLMENIEDELDERIKPKENQTINGLLEQLENDLRDRDMFAEYENLNEENKRIELLIVLHDRIKTRLTKVMKREELLDEVERNVLTKSFLETSVIEEDRAQLPAAMWEQVINKAPNKEHLEMLKTLYPANVITKFLSLMSNYKEGVAMRMQRRYENMIAQMRKELRKEDEKGKRISGEASKECDHICAILKEVKDAYQRQQDAEKRNKDIMSLEESEHSRLYDATRAALYETQKSVEIEALRGKQLASEIIDISEQNDLYTKANQETIQKIEVENMDIMKNIKRLNTAIRMQQERIQKVQNTVSKKDADAFEVSF